MTPGQDENLRGQGPDDGMERCQVTGKQVPRDEIVVFHGYRVCAEGKAEILRRLRQGLAMPGEMETSTVSRRFLAMMIDGLIILFFITVTGSLAGFDPFSESLSGSMGGATGEDALDRFRYGCGMYILFNLSIIAYYTLFHASLGQSIGKMAMGIMVVDKDGRRPTHKVAAIRAFIYEGVDLGSYVLLLAVTDPGMIDTYLGMTPLASFSWYAADSIAALADQAEQKSIHDRLAGTRVVMKV